MTKQEYYNDFIIRFFLHHPHISIVTFCRENNLDTAAVRHAVYRTSMLSEENIFKVMRALSEFRIEPQGFLFSKAGDRIKVSLMTFEAEYKQDKSDSITVEAEYLVRYVSDFQDLPF